MLIRLQGNSGINVCRAIGTNYRYVGTALLKDDSGEIISKIVDQCFSYAEMINMEILRRWVQGQGIDRSWGTLVRVLRDNGCGALAEDIEEATGML